MKHTLILLSVFLVSFDNLSGDEPITWLVRYDVKSLPQEQGWNAVGDLAAKASIGNCALHLVDDSAKAEGAFRAAWKPQPVRVIESTI